MEASKERQAYAGKLWMQVAAKIAFKQLPQSLQDTVYELQREYRDGPIPAEYIERLIAQCERVLADKS